MLSNKYGTTLTGWWKRRSVIEIYGFNLALQTTQNQYMLHVHIYIKKKYLAKTEMYMGTLKNTPTLYNNISLCPSLSSLWRTRLCFHRAQCSFRPVRIQTELWCSQLLHISIHPSPETNDKVKNIHPSGSQVKHLMKDTISCSRCIQNQSLN